MKPIIKTRNPLNKIESLNRNLIDKETARKKLGLKNKKVIGFVGLIRKYKGVDNLIRAMDYLDDVSLLIVGEVWKECRNVIDLAKKRKNIILINKYVDDFSLYMSAMDVVVLPYYTSTGSGILQISWGANRPLPVLASRNGSFLDLIKDGKNGLLFDPENPKDIAEKIREFYDKKYEKKFVKEIILELKDPGWPKMIKIIKDLNNLKKKNRIVVISESHRGGISHYNKVLCDELLKMDFNVEHISFKRVYPKFLYKLFFVKTLDDDSFKESKKMMDCLNPLTWKKAANEIIKYKPDAIVLNWSVYWLAPVYWTLIKLIRKKLDVKITLLCHNVLPHKKSVLAERFGKMIFNNVDSFIVQSSKDEEDLKNLFN